MSLLKPEQKFCHELSQLLPGHTQRIENLVGSGVPDINWCYAGQEAWIEAKYDHGNGALLRKEQYAWGIRRAHNVGNVFIVCWNPMVKNAGIWRYPDVEVSASPKEGYLHVKNKPVKVCEKKEIADYLYWLMIHSK